MKVPRNVAVCRYCGGDIYISEVTEWYEDDMPSECGVSVTCVNERIDDPRDHTDMPYVYWLPVQTAVYQWIVTNGVTKSMIELNVYPS